MTSFVAYTQTSIMSFKFPRWPILASSPPPFSYAQQDEFTSQLDAESWVIICLLVLVILALFEATIDRCITPVQIHTETDPDDPDLETAQITAAVINVSDLNNEDPISWTVENVERLKQAMEERRGQRLRALEEVLPLVDYGNVERKPGGYSSVCVICLESFQDGESCRIFPVCDHTFHSGCIESWVVSHQTCPMCRNSCNLDLLSNF